MIVRDRRFTLLLDSDTQEALHRLANAEERSMAAQIRIMVREEAMRRGIWTPTLRAVKPTSSHR